MLPKIFSKKTDAQIVREIHDEFDVAQERLLQQAKQIINSYSANNRAERLKDLGFTASEIVRENEAKKQRLVKNREQAALIQYYKTHYPFQKFLTEAELDRICKKYGLAYAPVSAYKKDVPEKNIAEIEAAKTLEGEYLPEDVLQCKLKLQTWALPTGNVFLSVWDKWRWKLPTTLDRHFPSNHDADIYLNGIYNTGIRYLVDEVQNITLNRQGLFIAAPPSHFDKKGLIGDGKSGLFHFTVTETKDPIVFRYCKGGVQVLSKWGAEAGEEGLINEVLN